MLNSEEKQQPATRKLSTWRAAKAVFWGFFGVRRGRDHQDDATHLTPMQIVIAGLIGGVLFVVTVLTVVNWVVP